MEYIIVQAGGKGTRLKYLTENKPKALVPVDNMPMILHLFRKYPQKRFVIIADYKKEVLREYLRVFATVKYNVIDASGKGTCSGIRQALSLIPEKEPFMLVWSDLILPHDLCLPKEYEDDKGSPQYDYVGMSQTFPCRWKYESGFFSEEESLKHGVAGLFLFTDKDKISEVPQNGEFVRWLQQKHIDFKTLGLRGTKEFGRIEEYKKMSVSRCRPFNKITIEGEFCIKEAIDTQGDDLARKECLWYEEAKNLGINTIPKIYETNPLKIELIHGKNIYDCNLSFEEKKCVLEKIISSLFQIHLSKAVPTDTFSIKEAYFNKTISRLIKVQYLIPYSREKEIIVNGRKCRNVYFYLRDLENALERLVENCPFFTFIHGDCTFSNIILREDGNPILIDPRGYFGFSELYGDPRYDWAKLYYSLVGNYDQFNLKHFKLIIGNDANVKFSIASNHWEDMEDTFFSLTGVNEYEMKLLHAVIWLSLTTYAWQDYDSICGAFYNGIYYLEELL